MTIIEKDATISAFEFWGNAREVVGKLTEDQCEQLDSLIDVLYPDGIDRTSLNDLFAFDYDTIAEWLGFKDFDQLERINDGKENWYIRKELKKYVLENVEDCVERLEPCMDEVRSGKDLSNIDYDLYADIDNEIDFWLKNEYESPEDNDSIDFLDTEFLESLLK